MPGFLPTAGPVGGMQSFHNCTYVYSFYVKSFPFFFPLSAFVKLSASNVLTKSPAVLPRCFPSGVPVTLRSSTYFDSSGLLYYNFHYAHIILQAMIGAQTGAIQASRELHEVLKKKSRRIDELTSEMSQAHKEMDRLNKQGMMLRVR